MIVASIPRCGSTLLARALAGVASGSTWPGNPTRGVHKTHHLMDACRPHRAVFVFGDPLAAVASTIEKRMDTKHFANCGVHRIITAKELRNTDALGYGTMWRSWSVNTEGEFPVLCVKYPHFWQWQWLIEGWTGRKLRLPEPVQRSTRVNDPEIERTYGDLAAQIAAAPTCFFAFRGRHRIETVRQGV